MEAVLDMEHSSMATARSAGAAGSREAAVFDQAAVARELREAALVAQLDESAPALTSIVEDVSKLEAIVQAPAGGRNEEALRERQRARCAFVMERLREYRQQGAAGDPVACYRLRNTIDILAVCTRRAVIVLGESRANSNGQLRRHAAPGGHETPGKAARSRAA